MRVLLSAFACHPGHGSEPNVGWQTALQVARRHQVAVLTDVHNQNGIQQALDEDAEPSISFHFVQLPRELHWLAGRGWLHHIYYIAWQFQAFIAARDLNRDFDFDIVHHVTYVNSWLPTFMGYLGIPFIWSAGPRERTPWRFLGQMTLSSAVSEVVRGFALRLLGFVAHWMTGRKARLILTSSPLSSWPRSLSVRRFPLGGLTKKELSELGESPLRNGPPFRVASIGRLLGLKGLGLAMHAFARTHQETPDSEYWIIGSGPEENYLRTLAERLDCVNFVRFLGWKSRREVMNLLGEIDVLLHPSFHEQFGYAMIEAMAAGKPVVCLDVGANDVVVGEHGGVRVPVTSTEEIIAGLSLALARFSSSRAELDYAGTRARCRARDLWDWDHVGSRILQLYEEVI